MGCHVSAELKNKYGIRSIPIRKGDEVKIVRGFYKSKAGKVTNVSRKSRVIFVEKVTREKHNGRTTAIAFHPSNCVVTKLNLQNQDRKDLVERKKRTSDKKGDERVD